MVTAPFIILLYDRAFISPSFAQALSRRRRYYLALGSAWLFLAFLMTRFRVTTPSFGFNIGVSGLTYALTEMKAVATYVKVSLWPRPLVFDYGTGNAGDAVSGEAAPFVLLLAAAAVATVWAWRKSKPLGFLAVLFFVLLSLHLQRRPGGDPADRGKPDVPAAGGPDPGSWPRASTLSSDGARLHGRVGLVRRLGLGDPVAQPRDFASDLRIWTDTVARHPGNSRAHNYLGNALVDAGRRDEAYAEYREALRLLPNYTDAHNNLGVLLTDSKHLTEAILHLEEALRLRPNFADAEYNLGRALCLALRHPEAIRHLRRSLQLAPDNPDAHNNLGYALAATGHLPEAIAEYRAALRLRPDYPEAKNNLGNALIATGHLDEATGYFGDALRSQPNFAEAHANLGRVQAALGQYANAIPQFEQALQIRPDYPEAQNYLGLALANSGRTPEAISHYEEAIRLDPGLDPDPLQSRQRLGRFRPAAGGDHRVSGGAGN